MNDFKGSSSSLAYSLSSGYIYAGGNYFDSINSQSYLIISQFLTSGTFLYSKYFGYSASV